MNGACAGSMERLSRQHFVEPVRGQCLTRPRCVLHGAYDLCRRNGVTQPCRKPPLCVMVLNGAGAFLSFSVLLMLRLRPVHQSYLHTHPPPHPRPALVLSRVVVTSRRKTLTRRSGRPRGTTTTSVRHDHDIGACGVWWLESTGSRTRASLVEGPSSPPVARPASGTLIAKPAPRLRAPSTRLQDPRWNVD